MKLHCLGTAGYHPSESRQTSCYFLPQQGIVLDAGTGLFRLAPLICTETIDILLSHAHLDHIAGLTFLLDILHQRPVRRVTVWGESDKLEAVKSHLFANLIFPVPLEAVWEPIDYLDSFQIGSTKVGWRKQPHPGGSVAYRIDIRHQQDRHLRLVYATDTTGQIDDDALAWMGRPDLLMHECNFSDAESEWAVTTGHSWISRAADVANGCGAAQTLLTHLNPLTDWKDQAFQPAFKMPVSLAEDHLIVDVEARNSKKMFQKGG